MTFLQNVSKKVVAEKQEQAKRHLLRLTEDIRQHTEEVTTTAMGAAATQHGDDVTTTPTEMICKAVWRSEKFYERNV